MLLNEINSGKCDKAGDDFAHSRDLAGSIHCLPKKEEAKVHFCPFFPSGYRSSGLVPTGDFPPPPPPAKGFYVPLPLLSLLFSNLELVAPLSPSLLLFEKRNPIRRRGGGVSDDGGSKAFDNVIALCQGFESLE